MKLVKEIKTSLVMLIFFTLLTGLIYPGMVTAIAQLLFPWQANGSLIQQNGKIVGSVLIGQYFKDSHYFFSRPSATNNFPYNAEYSSGSNLGPSNPALISAIKERITTLRQLDPNNNALVPIDLVTASASGLDPDISPASAFYQVHRIAVARNIPEELLRILVEQTIQKRSLEIFGEQRVNVLQLNFALDNLTRNYSRETGTKT